MQIFDFTAEQHKFANCSSAVRLGRFSRSRKFCAKNDSQSFGSVRQNIARIVRSSRKNRTPSLLSRTKRPVGRCRGLRIINVLKMLAVMEPQRTPDEPSSSHSQEFLTSGRTGRRNALPDILSEHAVVSSADLPGRLQLLTTSDTGGPGTSGQRDKTDTAVAGPSKPPPSNGGS